MALSGPNLCMLCMHILVIPVHTYADANPSCTRLHIPILSIFAAVYIYIYQTFKPPRSCWYLKILIHLCTMVVRQLKGWAWHRPQVALVLNSCFPEQQATTITTKKQTIPTSFNIPQFSDKPQQMHTLKTKEHRRQIRRMDHIENQRVKYSCIGIMAEPPDLLFTRKWLVLPYDVASDKLYFDTGGVKGIGHVAF